jgi:hypothetical protein
VGVRERSLYCPQGNVPHRAHPSLTTLRLGQQGRKVAEWPAPGGVSCRSVELTRQHREILEAIGSYGATAEALGELINSAGFRDLADAGYIDRDEIQLRETGGGRMPQRYVTHWHLTPKGAQALAAT